MLNRLRKQIIAHKQKLLQSLVPLCYALGSIGAQKILRWQFDAMTFVEVAKVLTLGTAIFSTIIFAATLLMRTMADAEVEVYNRKLRNSKKIDDILAARRVIVIGIVITMIFCQIFLLIYGASLERVAMEHGIHYVNDIWTLHDQGFIGLYQWALYGFTQLLTMTVVLLILYGRLELSRRNLRLGEYDWYLEAADGDRAVVVPFSHDRKQYEVVGVLPKSIDVPTMTYEVYEHAYNKRIRTVGSITVPLATGRPGVIDQARTLIEGAVFVVTET